MTPLDDFEQDLQDALAHLYDPCYTPSDRVLALVDDSQHPGPEAWRAEVRSAIEALRPSADVPETSRLWRMHAVLDDRYLKNLTQVKTAEHLGISPRHLRREQRVAVRILTERLLAKRSPLRGGEEDADVPFSDDTVLTTEARQDTSTGALQADETAGWSHQIQQELTVLQQGEAPAEAEVAVALIAAVDVTGPLAVKHAVTVELEPPKASLGVLIHPAVLRQILIVTVCKLLPLVAGGRVHLSARRQGDGVHIEVTATPVCVSGTLSEELLRELVGVAKDGAVKVTAEDGRLTVTITLPSTGALSVLVVDDNEDLVHVYRRYTTGTRFEIRHAVGEAAVFAAIDESSPDIIVLDVMLPDVDGWELLVHLHDYAATRGTPILVCSVIREPELALALGATAYLPKPVRRRTFIEALEAAAA
jgi:CheY-like chemotaxis protein